MAALSFFRRLFNVKTTELPSKTQYFTFYSAFFAYIIGGISLFVTLDFVIASLGFHFKYEAGKVYLSMVAIFLSVIGVCLMALSSDKSTPGEGGCLGTAFGRLVVIPLEATYLLLNKNIPLGFVLAIVILDAVLAVIMLIIWHQETENASFKQFFKEIWLVLITLKRKKINIHVLTQWIGYVQFFGWVIFHFLWSYTGVISNKISGTHDEGVLLVAIFILALHGWFHILAGGSGNGAFAKASIIYRITITIPYIFYLAISSQIERSLAVVLVIFDVFCAVLLFFGNYHKSVKTN